jgi:hypothetical protein
VNRMKKSVGAAVCLAAIVGFGSPAFAGEYSGSGKIVERGNSRSVCSFSGLDQPDTGDNPEDHHGEDPDDGNWATTPAKGRVQSPGQIVAALGPDNPFGPAGTPGQACRGNAPGEG